MDPKDRKRSIDVSKLSLEDADSISEQVGGKVRDICDDAVGKANKLLAIYGLRAKMAFVIEGLEKEEDDK